MRWSLWMRETMTSQAMLRSGLQNMLFLTQVWSSCHFAMHFHQKEPNLVWHPTIPEEYSQPLPTHIQQEARMLWPSPLTQSRGPPWLLLISLSRRTMTLVMWPTPSTCSGSWRRGSDRWEQPNNFGGVILQNKILFDTGERIYCIYRTSLFSFNKIWIKKLKLQRASQYKCFILED